MNKPALRAILEELENVCFRLDLDVIDQPERADAIGAQLQRALDHAQQRLDEARPRETSGNLFPSRPAHAELCVQCGRLWAPAGRLLCATCQAPPIYTEPEYTMIQRHMQDEITDAIRQQPQQIPGKDDPE